MFDAPRPARAGTRQEYRFRDPTRGDMLVAAIRSIDASGNVSAISNVASEEVPGFEFSGAATSVLSDKPIKGLLVTLTDRDDVRSEYTGSDGRWIFEDLPRGEYTVRVETTAEPPPRFPVEYSFLLTADVDTELRMIPFGMSAVQPTLSLLGVFKEAVGVSASVKVLRKWPALPVEVYVPDFINVHGLDYGAAAIAALNRWMELTGVPLFRAVEEPPASGVTMALQIAIGDGYPGRDHDSRESARRHGRCARTSVLLTVSPRLWR